MVAKKIDINQLSQDQKVSIDIKSVEDPAIRDSRLRREESDATLQRWKDGVLFVVSILAVISVGIFCAVIVTSTSHTDEEKKFATSTITLIIGALVGYWGGKTSK